MMKQSPFFLLLAGLFLLSGACRKDNLCLNIQTFKINGQAVGDTGKFNPTDILHFEIECSARDGAPDNCWIAAYDFGYQVNGSKLFVLKSRQQMGVRHYLIEISVDLSKIKLPEYHSKLLKTGDVVLFKFQVTDSRDLTFERLFEAHIH